MLSQVATYPKSGATIRVLGVATVRANAAIALLLSAHPCCAKRIKSGVLVITAVAMPLNTLNYSVTPYPNFILRMMKLGGTFAIAIGLWAGSVQSRSSLTVNSGYLGEPVGMYTAGGGCWLESKLFVQASE